MNNDTNSHTDCYDSVTNTLDIRSNRVYPSGVLSNLCSNGFRFEGMVCGSMEGFLQSLKYKDRDRQRQICSMKGGNARKRSITSWQTDQIVWWKGIGIDRQGDEFQQLVRRAYRAMFEQSQRFRYALMQTRGMVLTHSLGCDNPFKTILTAKELCSILTEIRDAYDMRDKNLPGRKKRVFVNMNVIMNCRDNDRALEAIDSLAKDFDVFLTSSFSWNDTEECSRKMTWIKSNLSEDMQKHVVITGLHEILKGDYLINDDCNSDFDGKVIMFGDNDFKDWDGVMDYLLDN